MQPVDRLRAALPPEAGAWLGSHGADLAQAWRSCSRPDWLIRMSTQVGVARGLLVHAAADLATDALARCPIDDLRPRQGLATALRWVAGRAPSSEAWALGFALSALAERHEGVAAETLRATACLSFACDDRADVVFYAHRADAARSVAHAVRALGDPSVASDVVRRRIPLSTFLEAFDLASRPPPRPATPSGPHAPTTDSFYC